MAKVICSLCGAEYDPKQTEYACPRCGCYYEGVQLDDTELFQKTGRMPRQEETVPLCSEEAQPEEKRREKIKMFSPTQQKIGIPSRFGMQTKAKPKKQSGTNSSVFLIYAVAIILAVLLVVGGFVEGGIEGRKIEEKVREGYQVEQAEPEEWLDLKNGMDLMVCGEAVPMPRFSEIDQAVEEGSTVMLIPVSAKMENDWLDYEIDVDYFARLENGWCVPGECYEERLQQLLPPQELPLLALNRALPDDIYQMDGQLAVVLPCDTKSFTLCLDSSTSDQLFRRGEITVTVREVAE